MAKKKVSKKSDSKRASKGKAAVEKGAKFEDTVADVYRLLGADVIQNIEICQKKVDILATLRLPGSPTGHRVIVECKDEKKARAQNQRVMQFAGLLDIARKTGEADSAAIITRVPWSDQAKGFAKKSGIELLTHEQKMAQLIDMTTYLKELVQRFEKKDPRRPSEPPLGAYYVDLSAERVTQRGTVVIKVIDDYINEWVRGNNTRHLAILGEYGTGKTSFGQKLAHDLAAMYLKVPGSTRIPILFNLREFTKSLSIESLVTSFLDQDCGVMNPRFRLFHAMNDAGIFLLVFDGFDEMAVRVDADTLEMNLLEIEKLAAAPKSKVIVTSRLEYFVSAEEEKRCLRPRGDLLAMRGIEYEPLKIVPWGDEQVNSFLKKRVPLIRGAKHSWTYYKNRIRNIPGLADLSKRPVLLDMIVKTLPQLIASGKPINRPNLYETYLLREIKRQKIVKKRTLLLPERARFSLLQRVALDFYGGEISTITFSDAEKYIGRFVKPPRGEGEAYTRDFLSCSFLIREGDQYRFSHRSIMEYLAATALIQEIGKHRPRAFVTQRLDTVVTGFLVELSPDTKTLWNWLESTKSGEREDSKYLGGNAATLLCRLNRRALAGKDLSGTNLSGADLSFADLRAINFHGSLLRNVSLINAQFLNRDLSSANLSDIKVSLFLLLKWPKKEDRKIRGSQGDWGYFLRKFEQKTKAGRSENYRISAFSQDRGSYLFILDVRVPDAESLRLVQRQAASLPLVQVTSLYADEFRKLRTMMPKSLRKRVDSSIEREIFRE